MALQSPCIILPVFIFITYYLPNVTLLESNIGDKLLKQITSTDLSNSDHNNCSSLTNMAIEPTQTQIMEETLDLISER